MASFFVKHRDNFIIYKLVRYAFWWYQVELRFHHDGRCCRSYVVKRVGDYAGVGKGKIQMVVSF
jgi:hypothetical protein